MTSTVRNHFIPQGYMQLFFNNNGKIWRLDKSTGVLNVFKSTLNIGVENNLYTVVSKITSEDVKFLQKLLQTQLTDIDLNIIDNIVSILNDNFCGLDGLMVVAKNQDKETSDKLNITLNDMLASNANVVRNQETVCTMYENDFYVVRDKILTSKSLNCLYPLPTEFTDPKYYMFLKLKAMAYDMLLRKMYNRIKKDISATELQLFKENIGKHGTKTISTPYYDLMFYSIFQMFRVPHFLHLFDEDGKAEKLKAMGVNIVNVQFIYLHFETIRRLSYWHSIGTKPILILNKTQTPFITSDRPCFNIYEKLMDCTYTTEAFELFFPISKDCALMFSNKNCYKCGHIIEESTEKGINQWNNLVIDNANQYVFSANPIIL